jgi:hypothetical protein
MRCGNWHGEHIHSTSDPFLLVTARAGRLAAVVSAHLPFATWQLYLGDPNNGGAMVGTMGQNLDPITLTAKDFGDIVGGEVWTSGASIGTCLMFLEVWP